MLLALVLILCILAVLCITFVPASISNICIKNIDNTENSCKITNTSFAIAGLFSVILLGLISYLFFFGYNAFGNIHQFVLNIPWFGNISSFHLAVDNIALSMMFVVSLITPIIIIASKQVAQSYSPRLFYSLIFIVLLSVFGVLMSRDLLVLFLFWELELIPMYLLISHWHNTDKSSLVEAKQAANQFIVYTFGAGICLLLVILGLFSLAQIGIENNTQNIGTAVSFDINSLIIAVQRMPQTIVLYNNQTIELLTCLQILFVFLLITVSIKLPSIPLHSWLPKVHKTASSPVSMIVAGILFIMGGYIFVRFSIDFFATVITAWQTGLAIFGVISIVLGGFITLIQDDIRKLIAYSNISHLGFVLLGVAGYTMTSVNGILFQILAHALLAVGLFYIVQLIYQRTGSYSINLISKEYTGLATTAPKLFFITMAFVMFTLGIPLMMGFVAESMIFYGIFSTALIFNNLHIATIVGASGIVLTAIYMLRLLKNIFFGTGSIECKVMPLRKRECAAFSILLFFSIFWGCYPSHLENKLTKSLNSIQQYNIKFIHSSLNK